MAGEVLNMYNLTIINTMNNLFDNKNQQVIKNHLDALDYEFSDNKKRAILICLLDIAKSDNDFHPKEEKLLNEIANKIGFDINDFLSSGNDIEKDAIYKILNDLDEGQKDWLVITAFLMIYADGIALMDEYIQLEKYFENIGITKERWQEVIEKTKDFLGV